MLVLIKNTVHWNNFFCECKTVCTVYEIINLKTKKNTLKWKQSN